MIFYIQIYIYIYIYTHAFNFRYISVIILQNNIYAKLSISFLIYIIKITIYGLLDFLNNSTGPSNWPEICATGKKQSPIDIVTKNVIKSDSAALNFNRYNLAFPATLDNNGHSGK